MQNGQGREGKEGEGTLAAGRSWFGSERRTEHRKRRKYAYQRYVKHKAGSVKPEEGFRAKIPTFCLTTSPKAQATPGDAGSRLF